MKNDIIIHRKRFNRYRVDFINTNKTVVVLPSKIGHIITSERKKGSRITYK